MQKELMPVNQNVIIDMTEEAGEKKTAGGIIIPDTAREKPISGKVVALSNIENVEISEGDTVFFKEYAGTHLEFDGKKFLVIPYADILAKLVETEEI